MIRNPLALVPSDGGEGGGLYSQNVGREVGPSFLPTEKRETANLADVLLEVGVFALSRSRREQLAADLRAEGIADTDVLALRDYLAACVDDAGKAQRTLAAKLMDATERKHVMEDLRKHLEMRAAKGIAPLLAKRPADQGQRIREENMERVRRFEAEWQQFERDRAEGRLPPFERRVMPWERQS
jgi:hypothetical protein